MPLSLIWYGAATVALLATRLVHSTLLGGDVVHISSGLTGLVLCLLLGKRRIFGAVNHRPHNVPFVVLGATLLWFGWFGLTAALLLLPTVSLLWPYSIHSLPLVPQ